MMLRTFNWCLTATLLVGALGCNREEPQVQATPSEAAAPHDDAATTMAVEAKYYGADEVRGQPISVTTRAGIVSLRGTVDSEAVKQRAVALAREVEGVTRVEDELRVERTTADQTRFGATADQYPTGTSGGTITPAWITTKIQAQYFVNPEVKPWNIDVTTSNDGVVTLEGEVDGPEDKVQAVRIATETQGVSRVEDRLRVKGSAGAAADPAVPARPDTWLTAKIQSKYFLDDDVKGHEINVETNNGVVTLSGTVENDAQRRQALALARNTEGVREVVDRLQLDASDGSSAEKPGGKLDPVPNLKRPDEWITMKVQAKYFLDQIIKGRKIDVDTTEGVVMLKGTVTSAEEKKQAEQIARETDGVRRVVNQLTIGSGSQ